LMGGCKRERRRNPRQPRSFATSEPENLKSHGETGEKKRSKATVAKKEKRFGKKNGRTNRNQGGKYFLPGKRGGRTVSKIKNPRGWLEKGNPWGGGGKERLRKFVKNKGPRGKTLNCPQELVLRG